MDPDVIFRLLRIPGSEEQGDLALRSSYFMGLCLLIQHILDTTWLDTEHAQIVALFTVPFKMSKRGECTHCYLLESSLLKRGTDF